MIINTKNNTYLTINLKDVLYICDEPTNESMGYYFDYMDKINTIIESLYDNFNDNFVEEFGRAIDGLKYNKDFPSAKLGTVWHYEYFDDLEDEIGIEISPLCLSGLHGGINFDYVVRYRYCPLSNTNTYNTIHEIIELIKNDKQKQQSIWKLNKKMKQIQRTMINIEHQIIKTLCCIYKQHTKCIIIDEEIGNEIPITEPIKAFYESMYKAYYKYFNETHDIKTAYDLAKNFWYNICPMSYDWHDELFKIKKHNHLLHHCGDKASKIALKALTDAYNHYINSEK